MDYDQQTEELKFDNGTTTYVHQVYQQAFKRKLYPYSRNKAETLQKL